jgi:cytosine/adenosine deaminase-related metal-dependent hydrolase
MRRSGELGVVAEGCAADLLVVDGDPSQDVTVLADRRNLRAVVCRGERVDIDRPWPERDPLPDERVAVWATEVLTRDRVGIDLPPTGPGG